MLTEKDGAAVTEIWSPSAFFFALDTELIHTDGADCAPGPACRNTFLKGKQWTGLQKKVHNVCCLHGPIVSVSWWFGLLLFGLDNLVVSFLNPLQRVGIVIVLVCEIISDLFFFTLGLYSPNWFRCWPNSPRFSGSIWRSSGNFTKLMSMTFQLLKLRKIDCTPEAFSTSVWPGGGQSFVPVHVPASQRGHFPGHTKNLNLSLVATLSIKSPRPSFHSSL